MIPKTTRLARKLRNQATKEERRLWSALQFEQIGVKFRRQHPIGNYIVDFYCAERKFIVEVDGSQHFENADDKVRDQWLSEQGYKVFRVWNNQVLENLEGVVENIIAALPPKSSLPQEGGRTFRDDFPSMQSLMNGKPLVYLDSGASAQKPQVVIDALADALEHEYANIHRGLYKFSAVKTQEFEAARHKIADFLGGVDERSIVFTRNATEGFNLVAQSWGRKFLKAGDEIILSEMEHHANLVPWHLLHDQIGVLIKYIPVLENGSLDMNAYQGLLSAKTKLVSVVHVSNALGTINDVKSIIRTAREYNSDIKIMLDGSQAVVHTSVDLPKLDPDFYAFTGHKLYGPTGVGVLYGRHELLESMDPYQGGGDMIETVTLEGSTYKNAPAKFEAGTPAIAEVIALGAAIDYLSNIGMKAISEHEQNLLEYATSELQKIENLKIIGTASPKAAIISFTMNEAHPSDIAMVLDQMGIAVRTGHHCCMPLMAKLGVDATVRASFGLYNTREDIDALVAGLKKVKSLFA